MACAVLLLLGRVLELLYTGACVLLALLLTLLLKLLTTLLLILLLSCKAVHCL
jgi:hypothetical protein